MAIIYIPPQLRSFVDSQEVLIISGRTLADILNQLISCYVKLQPYLFDNHGEVCSFINLYLNGQDIRYLQHLETPVNDADIIEIIPALVGG